MMTWRCPFGGGKTMLVWVLPNGWFVTTDGRVYPWFGYWPGVTGEDPEGGEEVGGTDDLTLTISLEYQGALETVSFRQGLAPYKRDQDHIDVSPGAMTLVGSGAYVESGVDVVLFIDVDDPTVWYYNQGGSNVIMTHGLGTEKGGAIHLRKMTFPGNSYPGSRGGAYTEAFAPS